MIAISDVAPLREGDGDLTARKQGCGKKRADKRKRNILSFFHSGRAIVHLLVSSKKTVSSPIGISVIERLDGMRSPPKNGKSVQVIRFFIGIKCNKMWGKTVLLLFATVVLSLIMVEQGEAGLPQGNCGLSCYRSEVLPNNNNLLGTQNGYFSKRSATLHFAGEI